MHYRANKFNPDLISSFDRSYNYDKRWRGSKIKITNGMLTDFTF